MNPELLDKRDGRIRQMFAEIAPCYDLLNHALSLNIDRAWRRRAVKMLPPEGDAPILDVCTGTGDLALGFAKGAGVPVIGSDFCHEMLARAVAKGERAGHPKLAFVEADAQQLPFASDTFQITTVAFGLRNTADHERALGEMCRVTRPGGRVAILEFSRPRHWLFGRLYLAYFRFLLPVFGQLFSRSRDNAYKYLPESVMRFPDGEELAGRMRAHGLTDVRFYPLTLGISTLYIGRKTEPEQRSDK